MASPPPRVRAINTADGSPTVLRVDTGWTYRSLHGAMQEATWVFVQGSRITRLGPRPRVLELGFGAGSNFAATWRVLRAHGIASFHYCAIDSDPLAATDLPCFDPEVHRLAVAATEQGIAEHRGVVLELHRMDFAAFAHAEPFDAIYYDPFGPAEQPESWSIEAFTCARRHMSLHARLVTYSAAGWVRRTMARAGLFVATAPGPTGKREFTIAAPDRRALAPHRIRNAPDDTDGNDRSK